jgi:hypothetical protein
MKHMNRWVAAALMVVGLSLTSCQRLTRVHADESPAKVVHIQGSDLSQVILTEKAFQRIALMTEPVREQRMSRSASLRTTVPYSSLLYGAHGETWVYTRPQARTFVRQKVTVDYIEGDTAVLKEGPPAGTIVVSVGVAELYGTEFGVGH